MEIDGILTPYYPLNHWKTTGNYPHTHIFPDIASKTTSSFSQFPCQIPNFTI